MRTTNIICSIINGGKTAENVTVDSVSYSTNFGTLTLSATVPSTVNIGDTITDSGGNNYLVTSISGSDLDVQDFDSTTDPVTGSATIQESYQNLTDWESDFASTVLYAVSGDTARAELYSSGGSFSLGASLTINGTRPTNVIVGVASGEENLGNEGNAPLLRVNFNGIGIDVGRNNVTLQDFEMDMQTTQMTNFIRVINGRTGVVLQRLLLHGQRRTGGANAEAILLGGTLTEVDVLNCIIYDCENTNAGAGYMYGLNVGQGGSSNIMNNTICSITNAGTGNCVGMRNVDDADITYSNNICMDVGGTTSGLQVDFTVATMVNATARNNMSEDATAPGTSNVRNAVFADQFVSTTNDFHLITGSDAIGAGNDEGTTPTGVETDIDLGDRDTAAVTWDIGADQFNLPTSGTTHTIYGNKLLVSSTVGIQSILIDVYGNILSQSSTSGALSLLIDFYSNVISQSLTSAGNLLSLLELRSNVLLQSSTTGSILLLKDLYGNVDIQSLTSGNISVLRDLYSNVVLQSLTVGGVITNNVVVYGNKTLQSTTTGNLSSFVDLYGNPVVQSNTLGNITILRDLYGNIIGQVSANAGLNILRDIYGSIVITTSTIAGELTTGLLLYSNIDLQSTIAGNFSVLRNTYGNVNINTINSGVLSTLHSLYNNINIVSNTIANELITSLSLYSNPVITTTTTGNISTLRSVNSNVSITSSNQAVLLVLRDLFANIGLNTVTSGNTLTFLTALTGTSLDIVKFTVNLMRQKNIDVNLMRLKKFNLDL